MSPPEASATASTGRVDLEGKLVTADGLLLSLQRSARGDVGDALVLPQLAALATAANALGVSMSQGLSCADEEDALDLWVRADPDASGCSLTIEKAARRPLGEPRFAHVADGGVGGMELDSGFILAAIEPAAARALGTNEEQARGQSIARLVELVPEQDGHFPMLDILRADHAEAHQMARRRGDGGLVRLTFTRDGASILADVHEDETPVEALAPSSGDDSFDAAFQGELSDIVTAAHAIMKRDEGPLRADYQQYATDIAAAGEHLKSVIRGLYRRGGAEVEDASLEVTVNRAIHIVGEQAKARSISLNFDPLADCHVAGHGSEIVQILVNLISNAIRYSPDGGTVRIAMTHVEQWIGVEVTDEGEGMSSAQQATIFERYERGEGGQSGIGLAVSRRLARLMGGEIDVTSAPGRGSTFTLLLPATD